MGLRKGQKWPWGKQTVTCRNTTSCACRILSNEIWYIRQNTTISPVAIPDSTAYDKEGGRKRKKYRNAVTKEDTAMKKMRVAHVYYRLALLRMQLAEAFEAGDISLTQKLSRMIDDYQLGYWKKQQENKEAAI